MALLLNAGDTVSRSYSYTQPSPLHPSQPQGTGERTGNLFSGEFSQFSNTGGTGITYAYFYIPESFTLTLVAKDNHTLPDNTFLGITKDGGQSQGGFTWAIGWIRNIIQGDIFTVQSKTNGYHYISMYNKSASTLNFIMAHYYVMLNLGSEALPYEPYGYKLDISCGDVITPIYLGEVVTTRRIKKLVLTGEENFVYDSKYTRFRFVMPNSLIIGARRTPVICTHYEALTDGRPIEEVISNTIYSDSTRQDRWWIEDERFSSANDFKAYLAEQYAAGTPVTIWYILTEPESAIVNEPLMKIGEYADTVSGITIPTIAGANTLSVDTTLQPSEVTVNYKGWHPVADVHERDDGVWT